MRRAPVLLVMLLCYLAVSVANADTPDELPLPADQAMFLRDNPGEEIGLPLGATKLRFALAVTEEVGYKAGNNKGGKKLDFVDVRRAYFHAMVHRDVFIKLPLGDHEEGMCG